MTCIIWAQSSKRHVIQNINIRQPGRKFHVGCTVCQCRLNGPGPLRQHLASSSHIKKTSFRKSLLLCQTSGPLCGTGGLQFSLSNNAIQGKNNENYLDSDKETTILKTTNLNPLGLGDGIDLYYDKVAKGAAQNLKPENILNLTQNVNHFGQNTDSSTSTMNIYALRSRRGPNGEPYFMRGDKGICYICSIELTSSQHCRQHVSGSKHIKKENESANRSFQPGNIFPPVNMIPPGNMIQPGNMFQPGNMIQPGNMFQPGNNIQPGMGRAQSPAVSPLTLQRETSANRILNNRGPNGEEYDVAGPGGHCFVCAVDFTSVELARDHLAGQRHRKKAATSQDLFQAMGDASSGAASSGQVVDLQSRTVTSESAVDQFSFPRPSSNSPLPASRGPNGEEYIMKDNRGFCFVCKLELTSSSHAESHLSGQKHKKKCLYGDATSGNSPIVNNTTFNSIAVNRYDISRNPVSDRVLMCRICNVPFSSMENARQHFESERHKSKDRMLNVGKNILSLGTQNVFDHDPTEVKQIYRPSVRFRPLHSESSLQDPDQTEVKQIYQPSAQFRPLHSESSLQDPGQTKVKQIYQPSAQLGPLHSESNLKELTGDPAKLVNNQLPDQISSQSSTTSLKNISSTVVDNSARLLAGFAKTNVQLRDVSFRRIPSSEPVYGQSHDSHTFSVASGIDRSGTTEASGIDRSGTNVASGIDHSEISLSSRNDRSENNVAASRNDLSGANVASRNDQPGTYLTSKNDHSGTNLTSKNDRSGTNVASGTNHPGTNLAPGNDHSVTNVLPGYSSSGNNVASGNDHSETNVASRNDPSETYVASRNDRSETNVASRNDSSETNVAFRNDRSETNVASRNDRSETNVTSRNDRSETNVASRNEILETNVRPSSGNYLSGTNVAPGYDRSGPNVAFGHDNPGTNVASGSYISETNTTSIGSRCEEILGTTIKTEIVEQNGASIYTNARNSSIVQDDNFSCKLKERFKVGDKIIDIRKTDYFVYDNAVDSLTDNSMQPRVNENHVNSTFKNSITTENLLSAEQNNTGNASVKSEASFGERVEPPRASHPAVEFHGEHIQRLDSDINSEFLLRGSAERSSEDALTNIQQSSILTNTNNTTAQTNNAYFFNGYRGHCYCCSVELTSMQHANQHLNGQKHQKKLGQWDLTKTLYTGSSMQTDHFQTPLPAEDPAEEPAEDTHVMDEYFYFNGSRGFCHVCNIELTSLQHARQHLNGKPHKRSQERFCLSKKGVTYPLNCDVCQKSFSGHESAVQHFTSVKHKSKVDVMKDSTQAMMVIDEGRVIMKDGQTWFVCDVCKVTLNTREQLLIHKDSPKHKKECEISRYRSSASPDSAQSGASPNIAKSVASPHNAQSVASPNIAQSGASPQNAQSVASPHIAQSGASPNIAQSGASPHNTQNVASPYNAQSGPSLHNTQSGASLHNAQRVASPDSAQGGTVHNAAISDLTHRVFRPYGHLRDSWAPSEEQGYIVDEQGLSRQINNLMLDSDKPQSQSEAERQQHESKFERQQESDRQQIQHERQQAERQQVLTDNIHYLTYGQTPVISQPSAASAVPSQRLNTPPASVAVTPVNGRLPSSNSECYTSAKQEHYFPNDGVSPALSPGQNLSLSHGPGTPPQTDNNPDSRLQFQRNQTSASPATPEYFSAQSPLSSSQESPQMYAQLWGQLQASSGHHAGSQPNWQRDSGPTTGLATAANSTNGNLDHTSNVIQGGQPNPHSGLNSDQGLGNSSLEDEMDQEDDTRTGQNSFNSSPENGAGVGQLGQIVSTARPSGQGRSRGGERGRRGQLLLEKKESDDILDDDEDVEAEDRDHYNIVDDEVVPKIVSREMEILPPKPMRSGKPGFRYFCEVCSKHMNTKDAYDSHIQGKNHLHLLSTIPAPDRQLSPIQKTYNGPDLVDRICSIIDPRVEIKPRSYQIELVEKTMAGDCIIYLPTGTGKTLVAVLTMGLMLQVNPSRPVLFLVDKVLLVMQQAQYIIHHFAGAMFRRQDCGQGSCVNRLLTVKPICGGLTTKTDLPIWKHDIVVTTADYCYNMLDRGLIQWKDFSLVVLDEVHHCNKGHPYQKLMSNYHTVLPEATRAKVLGLTASPAGKSTVQQTYLMLKSLLANLGGASVAVVEEHQKVLDSHQSMAKVRAVCVPMTNKEKDFKLHLLEYFILCYTKLASMTTSLQSDVPPCSYFKSALDKPGDKEVVMEMANRFILDPEPLWEVLSLIYNARFKNEDNYEQRICFDSLKLHICRLLLVIPEVGSGTGIEDLLMALSPSETIEGFKKMGLPCELMYQRVQHFAEDGNNDLTMFNKLVETLQDPETIDWSDMSSRALVLVRERKLAKQYSYKLRGHPMVRDKDMRVRHIVGHGKGAKDGGMDVKKQRKVFDIHEKVHILVATSIMEEGIDIQALQLVVCMNPPNSLRALVQMRGRARRNGSHFVVLCSSPEDVEKLELLQKQETHMLEATNLCLKERQAQSC